MIAIKSSIMQKKNLVRKLSLIFYAITLQAECEILKTSPDAQNHKLIQAWRKV